MTDADPLLIADHLTAGYIPGVNILNGCSLELFEGELVGIIGPNGAGKSTLVKAIEGFQQLECHDSWRNLQARGNLHIDLLVHFRMQIGGFHIMDAEVVIFDAHDSGEDTQCTHGESGGR